MKAKSYINDVGIDKAKGVLSGASFLDLYYSPQICEYSSHKIFYGDISLADLEAELATAQCKIDLINGIKYSNIKLWLVLALLITIAVAIKVNHQVLLWVLFLT